MIEILFFGLEKAFAVMQRLLSAILFVCVCVSVLTPLKLLKV